MPLSPDEQAELEALQASPAPAAPKASGGLSDDEAAELKALQSNSQITPEMHAQFQKGQDQSDAVLAGAGSGLLLGGQNMLGGAIQAGLDMGQKGLNKLGLASPSPTQVNAKLAAQGTTGDVGPTNDKDLYYQGKHETEANIDKIQGKNPIAFGTSQVLGGMALPIGAAGQAAKGATVAARVGNAALKGGLTGLGVGAGAGFLGGKNDLAGPQANPAGVAKDTAIGAGIGALTGGLGSAGIQGAAELPIQSTLSKIANNRMGAAYNIDPKVNAAKGVGQTMLDNNIGTNPLSGIDSVKAGVQNKIESLENELQPILKDASDTTTPKAKADEETFLDKLKSYKKFLDAKKGLDKHTPAPDMTTPSQDAQAAMPSAQGDAPPVSQSELNPQSAPTPEVSGDSGGLDPDTVNQLRQQMNPMEAQHADVTGESPAIDPDQLKPQAQDPMQAGDGESTTLLPEGNPTMPDVPQGLVTKQQLINQFDNIISDATKGFNKTPEDQAMAQKLTQGLDDFKQQIASAGNDPMALNEIKRRLYAQIKQMSSTAYAPGNEAVAPKIKMYQAIGNMLKTQVENLVNTVSPGAGSKVADINGNMSNLLAAQKGLNKSKPADIGLDALISPVKTAAKAIIGKPADVALANGADYLSKLNGSSLVDSAQNALPAIENKKVQGNIYNRDKQKYSEYAQKLSANPTTAHIGKSLSDALATNNSLSKAQALFLIQQNPQARKVIDESGM